MRKTMRLVVVAFGITTFVCAATIQADLSTVGPNGFGDTVYRYTYNLGIGPLQINQEVDIRFDPTIYKALSNPVAPSGFDAIVLQPNNPLGADGDFSILALSNNLSTVGIFRVDFTLLQATVPQVQTFYVNQLDGNGNFLNTVSSGLTASIPEPSTWWLALGALTVSGLYKTKRQSRR